MINNNTNDDAAVTLNIGGKLITTALSTLKSPLKFASNEPHFFNVMFTSQGSFELTKDAHGIIFIDRDGKHFRYISNFLRNGGNLDKCEFPFDKDQVLREIISEAEFYNLKHLVRYLSFMLCTRFANLSKVEQKTLQTWLAESFGGTLPHVQLLYSSALHTSTLEAFHSKCDNMGPTLTVIKLVDGNVCGGYTDVSWTSPKTLEPKRSNKCWLFDIFNRTKAKVLDGKSAMYCSSEYAISFGDLSVNPQFNQFIMRYKQANYEKLVTKNSLQDIKTEIKEYVVLSVQQ